MARRVSPVERLAGQLRGSPLQELLAHIRAAQGGQNPLVHILGGFGHDVSGGSVPVDVSHGFRAHHPATFPGHGVFPSHSVGAGGLESLAGALSGGVGAGGVEGLAGALPSSHPMLPTMPAPQDNMGHTNRPADLQHGFGNDDAAAQLWMQHHPGAMRGRANMPYWVASYLTQRLRQATPTPPQAAPGPSGPTAY